MSERNAKREKWSAVGQMLALLVTNLIKLGGLLVALNEVLAHPNPRAVEIGLAAFMMAGAQISEETLLRMVERVFGTPIKSSKGSEKTP